MSIEFKCDSCGRVAPGGVNFSGVWFSPLGWTQPLSDKQDYRVACSMVCEKDLKKRFLAGEYHPVDGYNPFYVSNQRLFELWGIDVESIPPEIASAWNLGNPSR